MTSSLVMKKAERKQSTVCFQDVWQHGNDAEDGTGRSDDYDEDDDTRVSNTFFELANAPSVSYRVQLNDDNGSNDKGNEGTIVPDRRMTNNHHEIVIQQDIQGAAEKHTGGIVWETAYLLLNYLSELIQHPKADTEHKEVTQTEEKLRSYLISTATLDPTTISTSRRTVLEVGSGCGMVGFSLHKILQLKRGMERGEEVIFEPWQVILTETGQVMDNLRRNCQRNYPKVSLLSTLSPSSSPPPSLMVCELDWTKYREHCQDAGIEPHSVDLILGTDVVFSIRFVEPLLQTMEYLSHEETIAILCLQERCPDSYALLRTKACDYGFDVKDISRNVYDRFPSCSFGQNLECKLLQFTANADPLTKQKQKEKTTKKKRKLGYLE